MNGQNFGDILKAAGSKEIDVAKSEVAIFKHFVQERKHPLDLVRELISNSGAREVGSTRIEIDGQRLAGLMIEHNIGVSRATSYEIKRVDSDYFEED